jgi:hypothetical protein
MVQCGASATSELTQRSGSLTCLAPDLGKACQNIHLYGTFVSSLRHACSPILSVSFKEMGCEPVLNLAATPDEAVSIICTIVDKTIPSTFGRS